LKPYTFHITLYDAAFFGTVFIGLTFALQLWFSKNVNRAANRFLAGALAIIALWIARVLGIGIGLPQQFPLALGPLFFFYVLKITRPGYQFRRKDLLYFSPVLVGYWMPPWLALISVIIYLYLSHRLIQDFYNRLHPVLMDRPRFAFRRLQRFY
jgi:putative ABC transport system permease protein